MKYVGLAFIALFIVLALLGIGGVVGWFGFSNEANGFEVDIPAQYKVMQNIYDNGWKEVMEVAQVPENYRDDMKSVWQAALQGRYGDKGSQAVLQLITESNPQIDASLYKKVQEKIETFRSNFSAAQTTMIAKKQAYGRFLKTNTDSRFYNLFSSYPHIKCGVPDGSADDYQIVTSGKTQEDFRNHESAPLDLRKK
jgi:hypothetical protein